MKAAPLLPILLVLAACAGMRADFSAARDSWRGATYEEVVTSWGEPARSATPGEGRLAHTWISAGAHARRSLFPSISVFGSNDGIGVGAGIAIGSGGYGQARCERTLIFEHGRVAEQQWKGPANYCAQFRR